MRKNKKCAVIACGVLAVDIRHLAEKAGIELDMRFLKGGLHEKPMELKRELQSAIDEVSATGRYDRILIGYGICGRGTIGIVSRDVPLVIPKVHDCIALFLGSDRAYREQFSSFPGTYYISAGWYEEKAEPLTQSRKWVLVGDEKLNYMTLLEKYGEQNTRELTEFLSSWQKNYQRAAYIDTGVNDSDTYSDYAKNIAEKLGWQYERIEGSLSLLEKLLMAEKTTDDILVVPPESQTKFNSVKGQLIAQSLREREEPGKTHQKIVPGIEIQKKISPRRGDVKRIGLGIDAGGTYTDAVIYDLESDRVLDKGKSLTTKWDLTVGIKDVLESLEGHLLTWVNLVAVSTTLATNAIVEGEGQKVGLLIMPPYGRFKKGDIPYEPLAVLSGRLEITGEEISPIDEAEIRQVADHMINRQSVKAFAVSGFGGCINPEHELAVKRILTDEYEVDVTCGHELSHMLDFKTRALTAVVNSRIIPCITRLLVDLDLALKNRGITAPMVVVKGDGTLVNRETALKRPVETILSGPAASVAGALRLTGEKDAIVVDMGGTTTDVAMVENGYVKVCEAGAKAGGMKTHVKALEIRTSGLGGDSAIVWENGDVEIGPKRIAPVAWLGSINPRANEAIDFCLKHFDQYKRSTRNLQIIAGTPHQALSGLTRHEKKVLDLLKERPRSLHELKEKTGSPHWGLLGLERLESSFAIQRCGLTPTDILNAGGATDLWNRKLSSELCDMVAGIIGVQKKDMIKTLQDEIKRRLAMEILKKQLDAEADADAMDQCNVCSLFARNMLNGGGKNFSLKITLHHPIIGIGAPIHHFLWDAASLLGTRAVLPDHAEVANAIGAVTSDVKVRQEVKVRSSRAGDFVVEGLPGAKRFKDLDRATVYAENELVRLVRLLAETSGTTESRVEIMVEDQTVPTGYGEDIFIGRTIRGQLAGKPDLPLAS